jgi:hypothetical protein
MGMTHLESKKIRCKGLVLLFFALMFGEGGLAQDLEPRAYVNSPIKLAFLGLVLARSTGELSPTESSPLQDAHMTIDTIVGVGAYTFGLAGKSAKISAAIGRSCYEGEGVFRDEYAEASRCENIDPRFKFTWNFYGAPALELADFKTWKQGLVIGASLAASAPLGTYNTENLINAGANRWMVRPGLGASWRTGAWQWELMSSVSLFEDNDDYFNGILLEQEPIYALNADIVYHMGQGRWISLDGTLFYGGETTKNGVRKRDRQDNTRLGVTYSMPVSKRDSIKLFGSVGVTTRIGNKFGSFGIGWLHRI